MIKKVKITKIEEWVPLFGFCKGFVVVVRKGCGKIGGARFRVFTLESRLLWYLVGSVCFEGFLKSEIKS